MKKALIAFTIMLFSGLVQTATCAEKSLSPSDVPRMTIEQLQARLGNSDLAIIDVRTAHDWEDSAVKIKGSVREDSYKFDSWITKYPQDKTIVLYCS
jgi:hypothetical protein